MEVDDKCSLTNVWLSSLCSVGSVWMLKRQPVGVTVEVQGEEVKGAERQ